MSDIVFGEPLPWDLYTDLSGTPRLLLRKGHILVNTEQFKSLLQKGIFADIDRTGQAAAEQVGKLSCGQTETISVVRLINNGNGQLAPLLRRLSNKENAQEKLLDIAKLILRATEINPDIALACVLLNQIAGDHAIRHCVEAAIVSLLVANEMGKPTEEKTLIAAAALTMNVGLLRYHEQLQSRRTRLSGEEIATVYRHPEESINLLKQAGINDADWISYVLQHHENEDGTGYPLGNSHNEIPQNAKIISLADRYCAQISARNYRKSILPDHALRDIFNSENLTVDAGLSSFFIQVLGSYPTGTHVRLNNGEIGVAIMKGITADCPAVMSIAGPDDIALQTWVLRDTACELFAIKHALHEDQVGIRCSMQQLWGHQAAL